MNIRLVSNILGSLCILIAATMLPSLGIAYFNSGESYFNFSTLSGFVLSIAASLAIGILLKYGVKFNKDHSTVSAADGFAITTFGWIIAAFLGALPYYFICKGSGGFGIIPAYFESMSGFTTTGSSVFGTAVSDGGYGLIEELPKSLLFWRSLTHWLGGMGIVVLALAILPALKAGGYQLFAAEVPGPTAERLQPRIKQTAAVLWYAYCVLTVAEIILLYVGGMPVFDSICHTFGTMATGGFSTKDASIGYYAQSGHPSALYFEIIIDIFMFLAGCNFLLHYHALRGKPKEYWKNSEFKFYTIIVILASIAFALMVFISGTYDSFGESYRQSIFQTLSIITTTGFATTDTNIWPMAARLLLIIIMFFGGCAGSTGGGLKQIRIMVMWKCGIREIRRLLMPKMSNLVRIGNDVTLHERATMLIVGLVCLWLSIFAIMSLALTTVLVDVDLPTTVSAVAACLNNIGPGLNKVGSTQNFHWVPATGKGILTFCMLLGRLEIYSVLVLLFPIAWRK